MTLYRSLLRYTPVTPHPWRFHRWQDVNGLVGQWGLVRQCERCHLVEVTDLLSETVWRGPASALKVVS